MAKTMTLEFEYAAAEATVLGLLKDPAFRESVCEAQHATSHTVAVEGDVVEIRYTQPVRGLPAFATKFVGDSVEIHQREVWSGQRATFELSLPGKPGDITGTRTLSTQGSGSREVFSVIAKVSVPLVGGKLEDLILQIFKKGAEREHRTALAELGG
ncbi:hypothetical protein Back2_09930 [Nocardioides baekrokdamisoli]|uniref:DUF2505 domain-containing protein n=1 Tax=Nocardioides baekrokdamisoli TaxID=1804624 RepID=A0A3G9IED5_9ACTN|nr:DUF2505 domain-containing protein [Nocardioides baekrokdamisoli]BBH16706.1 hypothetical protein Back2_09930 [Nocardioides baekrokdamisoli]